MGSFQIREGRLQGVGQCLVREYRMVCHVLKGEVSRDFIEVVKGLISYFSVMNVFFLWCWNSCLKQGCRAILVDKDKKPKVILYLIFQLDEQTVCWSQLTLFIPFILTWWSGYCWFFCFSGNLLDWIWSVIIWWIIISPK